MLSKVDEQDSSIGFNDPKYAEILRKINSADPTKYPLLDLELVMRELFQEDKLDSVIIASEKLSDLNSPHANFLRLNFYLNFHDGRISYNLRLLVPYLQRIFKFHQKKMSIL